jgi:hypothetical protein
MPQIAVPLTVWLDNDAHIASFHFEAGYERMDFSCHEFFTTFLQSLMEQGYRFM